jgi:type IV secretory pathway TrbD component
MANHPIFTPTARQTNWLIALGLLSLGYALYLRYMAIETTSVGLACQAGLQTWLCATRGLVMTLFNHSVFGWVALAAAIVNLIRPTLPVFALGLAAAAFGVVLYNVGLAGLAAALLILSFARPVAIESEQD